MGRLVPQRMTTVPGQTYGSCRQLHRPRGRAPKFVQFGKLEGGTNGGRPELSEVVYWQATTSEAVEAQGPDVITVILLALSSLAEPSGENGASPQ